MMRFVIVLLALAGAYFGYQWYAGDADARVVDGDLFRDASPGVGGLVQDAGSGKKPATGAPVPEAGGSNAPTKSVPLRAKGNRVVEKIRAGDQEALQGGFRELLEAEGKAQGQIEEALLDAAADAGGLPGLMAVLGDSNAFVHVESGRKLARKAAAKIRRLKREDALGASTKLLEATLRGPLGKRDTAAYDLVNELYASHKRLVDQVVFNPSRLTQARSHKVRPNETLDGIAAKFRGQGIQVEGWTLCIINRIGRPNRLQAGKTIKIPTEPIWARLEKESFSLAVYVGEALVRMYWVGHGKVGCETPETEFTVTEKLPNPDWDAPDGNRYPFGHPKNVLGRYFLKFGHASFSGFGAHGTAAPESIRTLSSLGCIRMHDPDIEDFFRFFPRRCKVVVAAHR